MLFHKSIQTSLMLCCLFLFFTSCEDKKSSQEKVPVSTEQVPEASGIEAPDAEVETQEPQQNEPLVQEELIPFLTQYGEENPENRIRITSRFGDIDVELFHDTPLHRANFIYLVKNNYFENTFFHRVTEDFVVQGGNSDNPDTNRKRAKIGDYLIPSEFEAGHKHVRGAFSAAKYSEQNVSKASSPFEFFIVQPDRGAHHLDNDHTVFGRVISGMDVVDSISRVPTDDQDWPLHNIYIDVELLE